MAEAGGPSGSGPWPDQLQDALGSDVGLAGDQVSTGPTTLVAAWLAEWCAYDPYGRTYVEKSTSSRSRESIIYDGPRRLRQPIKAVYRDARTRSRAGILTSWGSE